MLNLEKWLLQSLCLLVSLLGLIFHTFDVKRPQILHLIIQHEAGEMCLLSRMQPVIYFAVAGVFCTVTPLQVVDWQQEDRAEFVSEECWQICGHNATHWICPQAWRTLHCMFVWLWDSVYCHSLPLKKRISYFSHPLWFESLCLHIFVLQLGYCILNQC